jgi:hypothetical protein
MHRPSFAGHRIRFPCGPAIRSPRLHAPVFTPPSLPLLFHACDCYADGTNRTVGRGATYVRFSVASRVDYLGLAIPVVAENIRCDRQARTVADAEGMIDDDLYAAGHDSDRHRIGNDRNDRNCTLG